MATAVSAHISPEEYLERECKAEFRSEYFSGEVVAMSGAGRWHGRIVTNLVRDLGQQLREHDCNVYSSELRISVSQAGRYAYPEIVVTCGEEKFLDNAFDTLRSPQTRCTLTSTHAAGWPVDADQLHTRGQSDPARVR